MLELTKDFLDGLRANIEAGRDMDAASIGDTPKTWPTSSALKREDTLYFLPPARFRFQVRGDCRTRRGCSRRTSELTQLKEIAEDVIEGLDSDDAADALADLPEAKVEEAMRWSTMWSLSRVLVLNYEEGTAEP